ncbi:MAG: LysM peptidoglycan-binding domain-containing protein [Flavobacteriales bacterium]|nr:LysM peptidoglycan-binding domain-containing protein [Flavobacteriales bacterium]
MRKFILILSFLRFFPTGHAQDPGWNEDRVSQQLTQISSLPWLASWRLVMERETGGAQEFWTDTLGVDQEIRHFCLRHRIPGPYFSERCALWAKKYLIQSEELCVLKGCIKMLQKKFPYWAATADPEAAFVPWLLAFMGAGFREDFLSDGPGRAAGFWLLHPQRARVYGLEVRPDYDERLCLDRATEVIPAVLKDLGSSPPEAALGFIWGPAAFQQFQKSEDSALRARLAAPYDALVALWWALEKATQSCSAYFEQIHASQTKLVKLSGPFCLEAGAQMCHTRTENLRRMNPHWLEDCLGNIPKLWLTLPSECPPWEGTHLETLRRMSDSLMASRHSFPSVLDSLAPQVQPLSSYSTEVRKYHLVRKGETLSDIARRYGISREALRRLNGLRSDRILAGKRLLVQSQVGVKEVSAGADLRTRLRGYREAENPDTRSPMQGPDTLRSKPIHLTTTVRYHIVKSGETLSFIARKYGVSVLSLKKANQLQTDMIRPGQKLKLP